MTLLGRLFVTTCVIVLCIASFAAVFEYLNCVGMYLNSDQAEPIGITLYPVALWWGLIFRAPGYIYFGTIPLLIVSLAAEWRALKVKWAYIAIWALAGLLTTSAGSFLIPRAIAAVLAGSLSGYLYWMLAGHVAGDALRRRNPEPILGRLMPVRYLAFAILGYLAYQILTYVYYGGKLAWVSYVSHPDPGVPPFRVLRERDMTAAKKLAVWELPDVDSCLEEAPAHVSARERLTMMDWRRIENTAQADVCMFRLLEAYGDLSSATAWFEAQGFVVHELFSSATPYVERDGTQRVTATYSIRKNGPKFPTRGIARLYGSIPYSMSINATWSSDGSQLLGVSTFYNIL